MDQKLIEVVARALCKYEWDDPDLPCGREDGSISPLWIEGGYEMMAHEILKAIEEYEKGKTNA